MPALRSALALVYAGYVMRFLFPLLLVPYLARVLGAEEYGDVLAAMSLSNVVWLVAQFGFPAIGTRDVAAASASAAVGSLFGTHVKARLPLCLVGIAVGAVFALFSGSLSADPWLAVLATASGLVSAFNLGWYFNGRGRFRTQMLLEAFGFAATGLLVLTLVNAPEHALRVLWIYLCVGVGTTALGYALAMREIGVRNITWGSLAALYRSSTPIFLSGGLYTIMLGASPLILSVFASSAEVAFFGVADKLTNLGLCLLIPANQVLIPSISRLLGSPGTAPQAHALMRRCLLVICSIGVLGSVAMFVLAPYLVPLIFGPDFAAAVPMAQLLGLIYPFFAFNQVVAMYVLIPLQREVLFAKVSVPTTLCNLAATAALARSLGAPGVAWSRLASEVVCALALLVVLIRTRILRAVLGGAQSVSTGLAPAARG